MHRVIPSCFELICKKSLFGTRVAVFVVQHAVNGSFRIINQRYSHQLTNIYSAEYQTLKLKLETLVSSDQFVSISHVVFFHLIDVPEEQGQGLSDVQYRMAFLTSLFFTRGNIMRGVVKMSQRNTLKVTPTSVENSHSSVFMLSFPAD